jgi:hypothetical protein
MEQNKSERAKVFYPLGKTQLQQVSGGCNYCQPQVNAPSSLAPFAPSSHLANPGASLTPLYQQPLNYFHVF